MATLFDYRCFCNLLTRNPEKANKNKIPDKIETLQFSKTPWIT